MSLIDIMVNIDISTRKKQVGVGFVFVAGEKFGFVRVENRMGTLADAADDHTVIRDDIFFRLDG